MNAPSLFAVGSGNSRWLESYRGYEIRVFERGSKVYTIHRDGEQVGDARTLADARAKIDAIVAAEKAEAARIRELELRSPHVVKPVDVTARDLLLEAVRLLEQSDVPCCEFTERVRKVLGGSQ